jgi:hypothetical protein
VNGLIVPTFSRPEMLWCCLEHIANCPESKQLVISVCVDWHENQPKPPLREIDEVIAKFKHLAITRVVRWPHHYSGNSYNVMTSYCEALAAGADLTFMVEDDVMVQPDFFKWHYLVHSAHRVFCSIGTMNNRSGKTESTDDYASLGVCFPKESLKLICQHANHLYFSDLVGYCKKTFGNLMAKEDYEQDGLITRVMGSVKGVSIWPTEYKAKHIGWYGYHRPQDRPTGTLQERYEAVKARSLEHVN